MDKLTFQREMTGSLRYAEVFREMENVTAAVECLIAAGSRVLEK